MASEKEPHPPNPLPTAGHMPKGRDFAASLPSLNNSQAHLEQEFQDEVERAHGGNHSRNSHRKDADASSTDTDTTATDLEDGFDWDEEEGKEEQKVVRAKRGRAVYLAFMKLSRTVRTLLIGILGAGICITPLLVVQLRFRDNPVKLQVHVWSLWITIIWAASCVTYLVVDIFPSIIIRLIVLSGGSAERWKMQIELTTAVSGWLKLCLDVSWAWIALSVIRAVYDPTNSYWTIINRVMQALFSASLIFLVEKIFLQAVAINFHQKALADRIRENRLGLRALDRLSNAQPQRKTPYRGGHRGHRSAASTDFLREPASATSASQQGHSKKDSRSGTATPVLDEKQSKKRTQKDRKRRKKAVTSVIVDQLGDAIGQVALKNSKFNKDEFGSLYSARRLARKLFAALSDVNPPRSHLLVEDFEPYFRSTAEAHEAFHVFDKDGNGDISKKEMREAVQRIYRERKALVASLKDAGSAVAKLDAVLVCVAIVGIIFVCLLIFNRSNTLSSLVPLATIILGFSFIFGHSAQTLFESLIFIFSTHVFDVGDLVLIDEQPLEVKEFGLFSTTFRRVDGQEIVAPNAILASEKLIHNFRRSSSMVETTNLMVSYTTPLELIEELRVRMNEYVAENSREWSSCALNIDKMEFQNAMHLIVAMEHRPNWQDWGARWARRTQFMRNLKVILEDLDIRYTMPVQPIVLPVGAPWGNQQGPSPSPSMGGFSSSSVDMRGEMGNAGSYTQGSHLTVPGPILTSRRGAGSGFDGGM